MDRIAATALLTKVWAIGTAWMNELAWKFIQEERIANNFCSRNTGHDINRIEGNVIKIVSWLMSQSPAQWQPWFRWIHRHQHLFFATLLRRNASKARQISRALQLLSVLLRLARWIWLIVKIHYEHNTIISCRFRNIVIHFTKQLNNVFGNL